MFRVGEGDLERAAAAVPGAGDLGSKIQSSRELCIKEGKSDGRQVFFFFGEKNNCTKQFVFNYTVVVGTVSHKIHNKTHLKLLKAIHSIAIALSQKNSNRRNAFLFSKKLWQLCVHLYTHKITSNALQKQPYFSVQETGTYCCSQLMAGAEFAVILLECLGAKAPHHSMRRTYLVLSE